MKRRLRMNFFILSLWIKLTQRIIEGSNQTWPNDNKDEINDLTVGIYLLYLSKFGSLFVSLLGCFLLLLGPCPSLP